MRVLVGFLFSSCLVSWTGCSEDECQVRESSKNGGEFFVDGVNYGLFGRVKSATHDARMIGLFGCVAARSSESERGMCAACVPRPRSHPAVEDVGQAVRDRSFCITSSSMNRTPGW